MVWADKGRGLKLIKRCPFCPYDSNKEGGVVKRVKREYTHPYECGCGNDCSIPDLYNISERLERSKANLTYVA